MLKSHFFPRSKTAACAHTNTVCERERAIGGMFGIEISVFVGFGYVCISVTQFAANTETWPWGSCRKFFTCFLVEPHLPQAQTHVWTHRLEKISKPATHRDRESQTTFQIDHKSNAQRALSLAGCPIGSCGQKGSCCSLRHCRLAWRTDIWGKKRGFDFTVNFTDTNLGDKRMSSVYTHSTQPKVEPFIFDKCFGNKRRLGKPSACKIYQKNHF